MKFTINKNNIENAIKKVIPFLSKDKRDVTSNLILKIDGMELFLFGTDYDSGIKVSLTNVYDYLDGECSIDGAELLNTISRFKNEDVTFELNQNFLIISQKKAKTKLICSDEAPNIKNFNLDNTSKMDINFKDFIESIKVVKASIAVGNPKAELNGVYLHNSNLVSTNTRSMTISNLNLNSEFDLILHRKAIDEILKLNSESEFYFSDTQIFVKNKNVQFFIKLINGKFPDYSRVIPTETTHNIELNSSDLIENINIVNGISEVITFTFYKDKILIESENDKNKSDVTIEDLNLNIEDGYTFKVNSKYLLDYLKSIEGNFNLRMNDKNLPILLENKNSKCVIMPYVVE